MAKRIASIVFLLDGIMIALGAYGHGFKGRLGLDAELAKFAMATNVSTMIYVVWYFVSGCMLLFGVTALIAWVRLRRGDRSLMPVIYMIAAVYTAAGYGGYVYRNGDPFMVFFIVLGTLLAISGWVLARDTAST